MTTRETSIAMTAAVITERYFEQIFKDLCSSYFTTLEKIAELAIEFEDQYKDTNWEDLLLEPLNYNHPEEICSWDDVVMWWTEKRIKELSN